MVSLASPLLPDILVASSFHVRDAEMSMFPLERLLCIDHRGKAQRARRLRCPWHRLLPKGRAGSPAGPGGRAASTSPHCHGPDEGGGIMLFFFLIVWLSS